MEYLNEAVGESEDAFFSLESLKNSQVLSECFRPPTLEQIIMENFVQDKQENEIRIVGIDYAFANATSHDKTANTIIECMSLHWNKNRFERHVDYIEGWPAGDSIGACDRVRELFWDYQADYLVMDLRNGGETLYNRTTEIYQHPNRGKHWNSRGLTVADKMQYHVISDAKVQDLRQRAVDSKAVPCIIPIVGTLALNSSCWIELKKQLEYKNIKLLINTQDRRTNIEDNGTYFNMTSDEFAQDLSPFIQTDELINEIVNLKAEFKNDKIRLEEPRSGNKDRAVVLAYCNYIASLIENEWNKQEQVEEFDIDEIQLIW